MLKIVFVFNCDVLLYESEDLIRLKAVDFFPLVQWL